MSIGKPIILSNSNMWIKGREMVFELCKKFDYKITGIYFDILEEILVKRAEISGRSINVLRTSENFQALIVNQRNRMQPPNSDDFDEFFVVKSEDEVKKLQKDLIKTCKGRSFA